MCELLLDNKNAITSATSAKKYIRWLYMCPTPSVLLLYKVDNQGEKFRLQQAFKEEFIISDEKYNLFVLFVFWLSLSLLRSWFELHDALEGTYI